MKQYTQEEIERLVPEATIIDMEDGSFTIEIEGLYLNTEEEAWPRLLLQTRARLEVAEKALKDVDKIDKDGDEKWANSDVHSPDEWMEQWAADCNACGAIAREALAKLRSME